MMSEELFTRSGKIMRRGPARSDGPFERKELLAFVADISWLKGRCAQPGFLKGSMGGHIHQQR